MDTNEKLSFFIDSMTTLMESLCSCTATGYLGKISMTCDKTTTDEIVVQGQAIGTPTVSSDQMVEQLQNFILHEPQSLAYQGQALTYVQRCSVAISTLGEPSCNSASEPSTTMEQDVAATSASATQLPFAIIGGAAGGGVLLIIFIIVVFVVAMAVCRKNRRGKGYNMETRDAVEM
jgi:hypothetical protein